METFGNRINKIIQNNKSLLFLQGEMAQYHADIEYNKAWDHWREEMNFLEEMKKACKIRKIVL